MNNLEQRIYNFMEDGDKFLQFEEIYKNFYGERKSDVKSALNNLIYKGIFYKVNTFVGEMYGIASAMETNPTIHVNFDTGDGVEDLLDYFNGGTTQDSITAQMPIHASESHDVKNINDIKFKNMKYTVSDATEWMECIGINFEYLETIKEVVLTETVRMMMDNPEDYGPQTLNSLKYRLKKELKELAKIRSIYYKEIVEVANIIISKNLEDSSIDKVYDAIINLISSVEKETLTTSEFTLEENIPNLLSIKKSLIDPRSKKTQMKDQKNREQQKIAEQKKRNEEQKRLQEEVRKEKEEEYQKKLQARNVAKIEYLKLIEEHAEKSKIECGEKIKEYKEKYQQKIDNINNKIKDNKNKISSLGFFAFTEKQKLNEEIEELKSELRLFTQSVNHEKEIAKIENEFKVKECNYKEEMLFEWDTIYSITVSNDHSQKDHETFTFIKSIIDVLNQYGEMSAEKIREHSPKLYILTDDRYYKILSNMIEKGILVEKEKRNKNIYELHEDYFFEVLSYYSAEYNVYRKFVTRTQLENEDYEGEIIRVLRKKQDGMLISEMTNYSKFLEECPLPQLTKVLTQLVNSNELVKTYKNRKAYFSINKEQAESNEPKMDGTFIENSNTNSMKENKMYKKEILDTLLVYEKLTISELREKNSTLKELSNQTISALLTQLVNSNEVVKTYENRKAYFSIS